jgi:hypothetical protein
VEVRHFNRYLRKLVISGKLLGKLVTSGCAHGNGHRNYGITRTEFELCSLLPPPTPRCRHFAVACPPLWTTPCFRITVESSVRHVQYSQSWMHAAVKNRWAAECTRVDPRGEPRAYISAPLENTDDDITWWGYVLLIALDFFD